MLLISHFSLILLPAAKAGTHHQSDRCGGSSKVSQRKVPVLPLCLLHVTNKMALTARLKKVECKNSSSVTRWVGAANVRNTMEKQESLSELFFSNSRSRNLQKVQRGVRGTLGEEAPVFIRT